jgi:hypothetical protein
VALASGRDGVVTERNPTIAAVELDLGLGVEVCWPSRLHENGIIERWHKSLKRTHPAGFERWITRSFY